ncbi:TPM domain-containing protein [Vagococcus acidifermentans]|uniref:TPM domain-containing protein n=2 Tax=Vagococcus acidifermentans TaxID=564710 RepID=A0A430B2Z0_9ENTE|nr:hypothetical protein CBF27_01615 [Vagococcus acidifermentans]
MKRMLTNRDGSVIFRRLLLLLLIPFTMLTSAAVYAETIYVQDDANVLSEATKQKIADYNATYASLEKKPELLVKTVQSLPEGQSIEEYSMELAETYKVGDKEHDSGVIYTLAIDERQSRLEVGYGLEDEIPDAMTDVVTDETVKDFFREEDYDSGISAVVDNINALLTHEKTIEDFEEEDNSGVLVVIMVALGAFGFLAYALARYSKYRQIKDQYAKDFFNQADDMGIYLPPNVNIFTSKDQTVKDVQQALRTKNKARDDEWLPDYYDFLFAGGFLTFWAFCFATSAIRGTSVYTNHGGWFYGGDNDDHDSFFGGGGSGGSFGGGSFGGGGGTSSW